MENDYYDYINILAFLGLYKYENKTGIKVDILTDFRNRATNIMGDAIEVNRDEELRKIKDFVRRYSEYFEINDDIVKLKDNISYQHLASLEKEVREKEEIDEEISSIVDDPNLLAVLGVYTIREIIIDYLKLERELENNYKLLFTKKDNLSLRNKIAKLLRTRAAFLIQIHMLPEYSAGALMKVVCDLAGGDSLYYDIDPLNMDLYMQSDYYSLDEDSLENIENMLYDTCQYSIFGGSKQDLSSFKLLDEVSKIYFIDKFPDKEDSDNLDFNPYMLISSKEKRDYLEDRLFYLTYLDKLSKYISKYGYSNDLVMAYKRLLYSLDNLSDKLYIDGNLEKALDKAKDIEIDEESFIGLHDEILFMADEIFQVDVNEYTIRKLLMLATYYEITKNEDLFYIINNYQYHNNYKWFSEIIFVDGKNKDYTKKL